MLVRHYRTGAVFNTSKIQFKSNSQLIVFILSSSHCCVQYFKDTIQKQFTTTNSNLLHDSKLCSILQRYNSKAIHNVKSIDWWLLPAVFNTSKIQFKSNSQQKTTSIKSTNGCVQYFKDTIQKQFTTKSARKFLIPLLCSILQRYNSKAIHN